MQPSRAFLLRCWPTRQMSANQPVAWRFCLEEIGPERKQLGFVSLDAVVVYLEAELDSWTSAPVEEDGSQRLDLRDG